MYSEMEMTGQGAVMAYFKNYPGIHLEGLRKTMKNLIHNSWCI